MWLPVKNLVPTAVLFGYVSPLKIYWYNESLLIIINDMCNSLEPDNFWKRVLDYFYFDKEKVENYIIFNTKMVAHNVLKWL